MDRGPVSWDSTSLLHLRKNHVVCPGATMSKRINCILDHLKKIIHHKLRSWGQVLTGKVKLKHLFSPTHKIQLFYCSSYSRLPKISFLQSSLIQIGKSRKCCFGFSIFFFFFNFFYNMDGWQLHFSRQKRPNQNNVRDFKIINVIY